MPYSREWAALLLFAQGVRFDLTSPLWEQLYREETPSSVSLSNMSCKFGSDPLPPKCGWSPPQEKPSSLLNDDFAKQPRGGFKESNKLTRCMSNARWSVAAAAALSSYCCFPRVGCSSLGWLL